MPTLMRMRSSRSRPESWRCVWKTLTNQTTLETDTSFSSPASTFPSACTLWAALSPIVAHRFLWLHFQASIPFAVIGSNQLIEVKGKKIRGRLYPWGVVEVENPEHNDFLKLRTMLVWVLANDKTLRWQNVWRRLTLLLGELKINRYCLLVCVKRNCHCRTHMQDLQEVTQDLHYENFRSERLKRACR